MIAIAKRNLDMVKLILSFCADTSLMDDNGKTALILAVETGNLDIIDALIEHPFPHLNINAYYQPNEFTALMLAASKSNLDVVNRLLNIPDIDIQAKNSYNRTALDIANKNEAIRNRLLEVIDRH